MKFIEKSETNERFYSVDYDKQKLKEILEKLKDYSYVTIGHCQVAGDITKWSATERSIKKRVISFFNSTKRHESAMLIPETIVHHTENNCDYVTYDYSYIKLPDLYDYIDLIINDRSIINYTGLFGKVTEEKTGTLNMFYAAAHQDQLVLEGILNYVNSPELTNHSSINDEKEYDYKGLNELYKETLECFNFNLIAIKEFLKEPEQVDILKLQLKK
jgi:hypothetical protein